MRSDKLRKILSLGCHVPAIFRNFDLGDSARARGNPGRQGHIQQNHVNSRVWDSTFQDNWSVFRQIT